MPECFNLLNVKAVLRAQAGIKGTFSCTHHQPKFNQSSIGKNLADTSMPFQG